MLPVLKVSCYGCSLQTGTKIISIFGLAWSIISVIILYSIMDSKLRELPDHDGENDEALTSIKTLIITFGIFSVVLYSLLIVAAYQRQPKVAFAWLVLSALGYLIDIHAFIQGIIANDVFKTVDVVFPISLSIGLYAWWVVYSYWRELGADRH